jgi:hypothetical protein
LFNRIRMWFGNLSGPKKIATTVVAIAAGVSAILGAITGVIELQDRLAARSEAADPLQLVDAGFTEVKIEPTNIPEEYVDNYCSEGSECFVPALDFKLANSGEDPIIIERADLRTKKIWTFKAPYVLDAGCAGAALEPSFNYKASLPTEGAPYTVPVSLSQSLEPNQLDRFTITPRRDESTARPREDYVFLLSVSLVYGVDESDKVMETQEFLYGELDQDAGMMYSYRDSGECYIAKKDLEKAEVTRLTMQNKRAAADIRGIKAESNASLGDLLRAVS